MRRRVMDPRQQGSRLTWGNDLFQLVESVQAPNPPPLERIPQPDVKEITISDWFDAKRQAELADALRQP